MNPALLHLPDAEQHLAWIQEIYDRGVRRPGTEVDAAVVEWCVELLTSWGCEVTLQPVPALTSHPGPAVVEVWPTEAPDDVHRFDGFTMPFTTAVDGATFALDQAGGCAWQHVPLTELPVSWLAEQAHAVHDPTGELAEHVHTLPFGAALGKDIDIAVDAGAGALLAVFDGPWRSSEAFVPYDGVERPIPGVWLDRDQGAAIDALLAAGPVTVRLRTEVTQRSSVDHNVIATLTGPEHADDTDRPWTVVGSHHDAPWRSAVEDASGIAQVLAQAKAWAAVPAEDRPSLLAFLLTAAHMSDGAGTQRFLADWEHRDRIGLGLHLEHIAVEAVPDGAGGLTATDRPEVRWWFVSHDWADRVAEAVAAEGLDRSLVLGPETLGPMPPTDGGFYHLADIPMVSLLAAPMYLFDPADTPEMIHGPSLVPTSRAAARLIWAAGR
ncbi:MAG: M28 family metallopeptidase [Acidimicrobiales bacterium]